MRIPNADRAVVDTRKLQAYALNGQHRTGQHKARLFHSLLGIGSADADRMRAILLNVVQSQEAQLGTNDQYGQRYRIDFTLEWKGRAARMRSAWILRSDEDFPRLITCYPLEES